MVLLTAMGVDVFCWGGRCQGIFPIRTSGLHGRLFMSGSATARHGGGGKGGADGKGMEKLEQGRVKFFNQEKG